MTIDPSPLSTILAWFVAAPVLGRCWLAWMPPGLPGRHASGERAATYAASLAIGMTAALFLAAFAHATPGIDARAWFVAGVAASVVAGLVRYLARPATMVPRHEPALEPESTASRAIGIVAIVAALVAGAGPTLARWTSGRDALPFPRLWFENDVTATAATLALAASVAYGLRTARATPLVRAAGAAAAVAGLALARTAAHDRVEIVAACLAGVGGASSIAWFRRADARGLALAIVAYAGAGCASSGGFAVSIAGLAWIVVGTAGASRLRAAVPALLALAAALVLGRDWPRLASFGFGAGEHAPRMNVTWTPLVSTWIGALFLVIVAARWRRTRDARRRTRNTSGARPGHEEDVITRTIVTYFALRLIESRVSPAPSQDDPLLPALVWAALAAAASVRAFTPIEVARREPEAAR